MTDQELIKVILAGLSFSLYAYAIVFLYISVRIKEDTFGAKNRQHPAILVIKCLLWPVILVYSLLEDAFISIRNRIVIVKAVMKGGKK